MKKSRKISGSEDASIQKLFGNLDDKKLYDVSIREHKDSRSIQQNKRYWALITELGSFLGYNTEEMHAMMAYKYLSYKNELLGDEVVVVPSTTKLSIKAFNEYYNKVEQFAMTLGFKPDLEDYGY
jgi:hypothetical protein